MARWFYLVSLFFHLGLEQTSEFKPPEQVLDGDVPTDWCVGMSCEACGNFLLIVKF